VSGSSGWEWKGRGCNVIKVDASPGWRGSKIPTCDLNDKVERCVMFDTVVSICPELFSQIIVLIPDAVKSSVISIKNIVA
jgi:hypothetical protein